MTKRHDYINAVAPPPTFMWQQEASTDVWSLRERDSRLSPPLLFLSRSLQITRSSTFCYCHCASPDLLTPSHSSIPRLSPGICQGCCYVQWHLHCCLPNDGLKTWGKRGAPAACSKEGNEGGGGFGGYSIRLLWKVVTRFIFHSLHHCVIKQILWNEGTFVVFVCVCQSSREVHIHLH